MMADKYYAWSRFKGEMNEWGQVLSYIEPGDPITQEKLGVDDDEWNELVSIGAVRTAKYPDIPSHVSPVEHFQREVAAGNMTTDEANRAMGIMPAQPAETESKSTSASTSKK